VQDLAGWAAVTLAFPARPPVRHSIRLVRHSIRLVRHAVRLVRHLIRLVRRPIGRLGLWRVDDAQRSWAGRSVAASGAWGHRLDRPAARGEEPERAEAGRVAGDGEGVAVVLVVVEGAQRDALPPVS
jgi:hypothetical protein